MGYIRFMLVDELFPVIMGKIVTTGCVAALQWMKSFFKKGT